MIFSYTEGTCLSVLSNNNSNVSEVTASSNQVKSQVKRSYHYCYVFHNLYGIILTNSSFNLSCQYIELL